MGKGSALYILRYADELRDPKSYFEDITTEPDLHAVKLAAKLIQRESGRFQPAKMPDQFAAAVREMIQAKVENRAPEVIVETVGKPEPAVINIMDALKESMQAKGRSKVREALRKRAGKRLSDEVGKPAFASRRPGVRRTIHHA